MTALAEPTDVSTAPSGFRLGAWLWTGVVVLIAGLWIGALLSAPQIPGLPVEPAITVWLLPIARFAREIVAALAVGSLVVGGLLWNSATALRWGRLWTGVWLVLLAPLTLLYVSEVDAYGLSESATAVGPFLTGTPVGQVLLAQGVALVLSLAFFWQRWICAALALIAAALPALLGHGGLSSDHVSATVSLALHVAAVSVWVGGLAAAVALALLGPTGRLLPRFSLMALWCVIVVGETGLLNVSLRLGAASQFTGTLYGSFVLMKAVLLGFLIRWGWQQRSRVLPDIAEAVPAAPRALARYAGYEFLAMGAALALSVVLARLGPPNPAKPGEGFTAVALAVLAFGVPLLITTCTDRRPSWVAGLARYPEVAAIAFVIVLAACGGIGIQDVVLGHELGTVIGSAVIVGAGWAWLAASRDATGWLGPALVLVGWLLTEGFLVPNPSVSQLLVTTASLIAVLALRRRLPQHPPQVVMAGSAR